MFSAVCANSRPPGGSPPISPSGNNAPSCIIPLPGCWPGRGYTKMPLSLFYSSERSAGRLLDHQLDAAVLRPALRRVIPRDRVLIAAALGRYDARVGAL